MISGRHEVRLGPCQAATPAAVRHASNAFAREAVGASRDEVARDGENVVGGHVHRQEPLG